MQSIRDAMSPSGALALYAKMFKDKNIDKYKSYSLEEEIRGRPFAELAPDQAQKWNASLAKSVSRNRMLLFFARRLRDYQRSPLYVIPSIAIIVRLIMVLVLSFTMINYSMFKIDRGLYRFDVVPGVFSFLYYSFNALILNSVDEIKPDKPLSQSIFMVQEALSFFVGLMLVTLVFSQKTQRASADLDEAIRNAEGEAASMEVWIISEYRVANLQKALDHLKDAETSLAKFAFWLTKGI